MTTVLVTGATGRLGSLAVRALRSLDPTVRVHALVRSPSARLGPAVEPRVADYRDPASVHTALRGVDRLLFVSSPVLDPEERARHHRVVLDAAGDVGHAVYTSVHGADHDPAHAATEASLARRGTRATVLRNGFYTEPFVEQALREAPTGAIGSASGDRPLATASLPDLAEAAARAVLAPPDRRVLELRGPAWTYPSLARLLSERLGHPVAHHAVAPEAVGDLAPLHAVAAAGLLAAETTDLALLLGRAPRGIADVVAEPPSVAPPA